MNPEKKRYDIQPTDQPSLGDLAVKFAKERRRNEFFNALKAAANSSSVTGVLQQVIGQLVADDNDEFFRMVLVEFPQLDMQDYMGKLGLDHPGAYVAPKITESLFASPQFRRILHKSEHDPMITNALGNIAMQKEGGSTLLKTCLTAALKHVASVGDFAARVITDSMTNADLHDIKVNCFNRGHVDNFRVLADYLSPDGAAVVLKAFMQNGIGKAETSLEPILEKLDILLEKIPQEQIISAVSHVMGGVPPQVHERLKQAMGETGKPVDMLLATCEKTRPLNRWSVKNLQALLSKHTFDELEIFTALIYAVDASKPEHVNELCRYAQQHGFDIINNETADGKTLLTMSLTGKSAEKSRLSDVLIANGADNRNDRDGTNPMSLMSAAGMQRTAGYTQMERVLKKTVDVRFARLEERERAAARIEMAPMEERARIAARLELAPEAGNAVRAALIAAGVTDENIIQAAVANAVVGIVAGQQAAPAPALGVQGPHTRRLVTNTPPDKGQEPESLVK